MEGIGRQMSLSSTSRVSWATGEVAGIRRSDAQEEDEEALTWAAIEKLPTYHRLRTTIMQSCLQLQEDDEEDDSNRQANAMVVDVTKLNVNQTQQFIDRLLRVTEQDNQKFLEKIRNRLDKVGITIPTVEVRFEHLSVEANCHIGNRALPTLLNVTLNIFESAVRLLGIKSSHTARLGILKDVSGIVRPKRMTLLLGPPSSGKTTLLLALAGKLDPDLEVNGEVTYNGHRFNEFVPQKTSAYISQNDFHIGKLTVKETLDFSARCQGPGTRYALLNELIRREKHYGITPEPDIDLFMKATSIEGTQSSLITDYTLKILGLDICRDTIVGDSMTRGISGGQKKRVTTGEMIVGPTNTLFMDEISTGLDSSTTFQIVKCMQQIAHLTDATILMSLLQPDPETFNLFDDVFLLSEGHIVYQGPRDNIIDFFESCGFRCPDRKGIADFLQEVTSIKDQEQYWSDPTKPYRYVSVTEFVDRFKKFHVGVRLENELSVGFNKSHSHPAALVLSKYTIPKMELLQACFHRERLLMRKNYYIYIFKFIQLAIMSTILSTVFIRTKMHHRNVEDGTLYIGPIQFTMIVSLFNGFSELSMTIMMLPVFYKQRDLLFHPAWAYTLPSFLLGIPITLLECSIWSGIIYYSIGFAPEPIRFFKFLLIIFLMNQTGRALFKFIAAISRVMVIANTGGSLILLMLFQLGGLTIPRDRMPDYWAWAYWITPLSYCYNALAVNEMLAPRWMNEVTTDNTPVGLEVLNMLGEFPHQYWYWIGVAALTGFIILFNVLFTLALAYLNPIGRHQAIISTEEINDAHHHDSMKIATSSGVNIENSSRNGSTFEGASTTIALKRLGGMVLPFTPLAMTFHNVNYYVDMPVEMKAKGVNEDKLQLLKQVTGSFRPGVLTALMGVSGAGKTTLMDVLAGRKTSGYIDGDIKISGFPKKQQTFTRISGYCEQNDIHSPQLTVEESLIFSASLRLPKHISDEDKLAFVNEVMELVEVDIFKDAIVGLPGITGLSTEQRKRLTIAVELVANPSIIFMDEPTSGLDARAAAIVMRSVRKTVDTGRTVVCTIHQPSIDIFEAFDEMLLLKRGGQVIYSGPLGRDSQKLIEYFEAIPRVPKIKDKYNPAMWMLEVSSVAMELQLGMDFAEYYKSSYLYRRNVSLVMELSSPTPGAHDVCFSTKYSQTIWGQFKSCFWKQWWTYWRSPEYNLVRFFFTLMSALIIGSMFWKVGNKIESANDLRMVIGAMYSTVLFIGVNNCSTVQPVVFVERSVFYRERAAGMYSSLPYAIAMVICEVSYVFVQATYYTVIVYGMMGFQWTATKFLWFFFISYLSFLYFTFYGMMTSSITPNQQIAAICAGAFYGLFNVFSGFFIPRSRIPKWWIWYYWICPVAWTVYGMIASQYGDANETIQIPGLQSNATVKMYIKYYYGYNADFLGVVALLLVAFTLFFAFIFALCIRILNFQTR